jgi:starch phosphorylase
VTNGIHVQAWDSQAADALWTRTCGRDRWLGEMANVEKDLRAVPDAELWQMRSASRTALIEYVRERYARQLAASGASPEDIAQAGHVCDPNALTLGFARRFATYKRPNLLLHDQDRLVRILTNAQHPVQLIVAGKAHPADQQGQAMVREWVRFTYRPEVRGRVIFLSDYDMLLTEHLVGGVDVWINNPRRPWEACGTSGMKVLANGGLNLSELDGWWAEAYSPEVGWALGDGREHSGDPAWDAAEADALYRILEQEVIPEFYDRNDRGLPAAWLNRMRESMATLTARFSANRAVREYTERHYLPAAANYLQRAANGGAIGKAIASWKRALAQHWSSLHFGEMRVHTVDGQHDFQVEVFFGELDPGAVRMELFANGLNGGVRVQQEMSRGEQLGGDGYQYSARVYADRPASDYTPRVIPQHIGASVPLDANYILWQH